MIAIDLPSHRRTVVAYMWLRAHSKVVSGMKERCSPL